MKRRTLRVLIVGLVLLGIAAIAGTFLFVKSMTGIKDSVRILGAVQAMKKLKVEISSYRQENGSLPTESTLDKIRLNIPGAAMLGSIQYRAQWISSDSTGDEILAYTKKDYRSWFSSRSGYIVLRLNGQVQWTKEIEFESLLKEQ